MRSQLEKIWRGEITPPDAAMFGSTLGQAFNILSDATSRDAVELRSSQSWLLTDIPWEYASLPDTGDNVRLRLGDLVLLRVPTEHASPPLNPRPTVLVAVAHITSQLTGPIFPAQFVPGLSNVLKTAPPFQVVCELGAATLQPLYAERLFEAARNFDPDVIVLVAHGKAIPPTVYFENDQTASTGAMPTPVTVAELTKRLGMPRLVILLCCDITRATGGPSGALSLINSGVAEAITMQGEIPQNHAAAFVKRALITLHRRGGLAEAVLAGRNAIVGSGHELTPVGFSALSARASAERWEDARTRYDRALAALLPAPVPALPRRNLDDRIATLIEKPGCRLVRTPFDPTGRSAAGPFAAYLLKQASDRSIGPRRPALILDYGARAGSREDSSAHPWDLLFDRVVATLQRAEPLLPHGSTPASRTTDQDVSEAARQLIDVLDRTGICLLVIRAHIENESDDFWSQIATIGQSRLGNGVLLIAPHPDSTATLEAYFAGKYVDLPSLGRNEIVELFQPALSAAGITAETLLARTAGNPLLLYAVQEAARSGSKRPIDLLAIDQVKPTADALATVVINSVEQSLLPTMLGLCFLEEPTSEDALVALFPHAGLGLLNRLSSLGFLGKVPSGVQPIDETQDFFQPVEEFTNAVRTQIELDRPDAISIVSQSLLEHLPDVGAVRGIIARPGGLAVLAAAQRILNESSQTEPDDSASVALAKRAFELGVWASEAEMSSGQVSSRLLLKMLESSQEIGEFCGAPSADVLFAIANTAHAIGDEDRADGAIASLRELSNVPLELQIRSEWLAADRLKDIDQAHGRDEALEHLVRARRLLVNVKPDEIEPALQRVLLNDVLYTTMKIALFLQNRTVDELPPMVRDMVDHPTFPLEEAVVLCTFVEQEMRQDNPNWAQIDNWYKRAEPLLLDPAGAANLRAYCAYQVAQALRRMPTPNLQGSFEYYRLAEQLAKTGDDNARQGLAAVRRAELLIQDPSLGDSGDLAGVDLTIAELARTLMGKGAAGLRHAFQARVLVRLHRMRAQLARAPGERAEHHRAAALAGKAPVLAS